MDISDLFEMAVDRQVHPHPFPTPYPISGPFMPPIPSPSFNSNAPLGSTKKLGSAGNIHLNGSDWFMSKTLPPPLTHLTHRFVVHNPCSLALSSQSLSLSLCTDIINDSEQTNPLFPSTVVVIGIC